MYTPESIEALKRDIRSVLIAEKDGIGIQSLEKEFSDLTGEQLKYDKYLYPTLKEFLLTIPDACAVKDVGYETLVLPITSSKNDHIQELVQGQKDNKSQMMKKTRLFGAGRFNGGRRVFNKYVNRKPYTRSFPPRDTFGNRSYFATSRNQRPVSPILERRPRRQISPDNVSSTDKPAERRERRYFGRNSPSPKRIRISNHFRLPSSFARSSRRTPERRTPSATRRRMHGSRDRTPIRRDGSRDRQIRRRRSPVRSPTRRNISPPVRSLNRHHSQESGPKLRKISPTRSVSNHCFDVRKQSRPQSSQRERAGEQNSIKNDFFVKLKTYRTTDSRTHKAPKNLVNQATINANNKAVSSFHENRSDDRFESDDHSFGIKISDNPHDPRRRVQSFTASSNTNANQTKMSSSSNMSCSKINGSFDIGSQIKSSKMNSSFDIRSQANKIPVKLFNYTPPPTPPRLQEKQTEKPRRDSSERSSDDECVILNQKLIRRVRDHSPSYRIKLSRETSEVSRLNSIGSSSVWSLDDSDYSSPLITHKSLRSNNSKSRNSIESLPDNDPVDKLPDMPTFENIKMRRKCFENLECIRLQRPVISKSLMALPSSISEIVPQSDPFQGVYISTLTGTKKNGMNHRNFVFNKKVDDSINYKLRLKKFCREHHLPDPIFEPGVCTSDEGLIGYFCNLLIQTMSWCTVLKTHSNPNDAENSVSKIALETLQKKVDAAQSVELQLDEKNNDETKCDNELIEKIKKLFTTEKENLYSCILEKRFFDVYQQKLTKGWLDSVRSSSNFAVME